MEVLELFIVIYELFFLFPVLTITKKFKVKIIGIKNADFYLLPICVFCPQALSSWNFRLVWLIQNRSFLIEDGLGSDRCHECDNHDSEFVNDNTPDKDGKVPAHDKLFGLAGGQFNKGFDIFSLTCRARVVTEYHGHNDCSDPEEENDQEGDHLALEPTIEQNGPDFIFGVNLGLLFVSIRFLSCFIIKVCLLVSLRSKSLLFLLLFFRTQKFFFLHQVHLGLETADEALRERQSEETEGQRNVVWSVLAHLLSETSIDEDLRVADPQQDGDQRELAENEGKPCQSLQTVVELRE